MAPGIVCADGGADVALAKGLDPLAVIGDFDSLSDRARMAIAPDRLHPIAEQDSTDFDKCLRHIAAPLVLGIGFDGSRIDHQLAAFNALVRHPDRRCILLGGEMITFVAPPELRVDLPVGTLLSLFPMARVEGRSNGLRWPIEGLQFAPDGRVGTSNEVCGPVHLWLDDPKMLVMLPLSALPQAAAAVMAAPAWPVRAE
ncbi:thiamine pyrophosphokinase [Thalassovita gelatinovora]|uniref:Thiamine diphosphokinase n=2 Tax=Thalassovita gelatinovora TaxID=53501 RepID=A0A0P1FBR2_THAGE|nr:thiamine diphosphokinase [Thalassovita gelatinovora]CUH65673.1 thiamine pyrophosphokinase [Thalassovita gelatinovora]SER05242.1 thiamine diphosphokinase [Thalassovita gelatinovora]